MTLSIPQRMLLFVLLPTILAVSIISYASHATSEDLLENHIREELVMVTKAFASGIAIRVNTVVTMLEHFAGMETVKERMRAAPGDEKERREGLARITSVLHDYAVRFSIVEEGGIVDGAGVVLAHSDSGQVGGNVGDRLYVAEALGGGRGSMTMVSKLANTVATCIAVPITDYGKVIGAVYGVIDWRALSESLVKDVELDPAATVYVLDRHGTVLMHPQATEIGKDYSQNPLFKSIPAPAHDGSETYELNGVSYVAHFERIPFTEWVAVIQVSKAAVLAPLKDLRRQNTLLAVACTLVAVALAAFIAISLSCVLKRLGAIANKVAAGDLELTEQERLAFTKDCSRRDEIGSLCRGARSMLLELRALIADKEHKTASAERLAEEAQDNQRKAECASREGMLAAAGQLTSVVEIISASSTQLAVQITQAEQGAGKQAERTSETASAMQKVNSAVLEVAKSACAASSTSSKTRKKAEAGTHIINMAAESIQKVHEGSLLLRETMQDLDEQAKAGDRIISIISYIADQTHHLALNASIEAARAKEAGRGFSAVAEEVGKLANKAMLSTENVGSALRSIQQSTAKSMEQVEAAVVLTQKAAAFALESGAVLKDIVSLADKAASQVYAIASSCREHAGASKHINHSVTQVDAIARETAEAMREAARAVSGLAEQSGVLNRLIEEMKRP